MKITMESTGLITEVQGITCRIWRGVTERGTEVDVVVPLIRVRRQDDASELERELLELKPADVARKVGILDDWDKPISLRQIL
jgi:hypothetical protein